MYIYVDICTYAYTYIYTHTCTETHPHIHAHICIHVHTYIMYTYMYVDNIHVPVQVHACVHAWVLARACMWVCICICACSYLYIDAGSRQQKFDTLKTILDSSYSLCLSYTQHTHLDANGACSSHCDLTITRNGWEFRISKTLFNVCSGSTRGKVCCVNLIGRFVPAPPARYRPRRYKYADYTFKYACNTSKVYIYIYICIHIYM